MKTVNSVTYWSLAEFADAAEKYDQCSGAPGSSKSDDFCGGASWAETLNFARKGWNSQLDSALELAESAVTLAEKEHMVDSFNQPVWDVTGAQVDVGAYLAGTPECMIDYPLTETSKVGRVITLCASVSYSGSIAASTIQRRGRVMVALAYALARLGHNTELWADFSGSNFSGEICRMRVLVKGADDELDPSRVMFAYAHPAMLRRLGFSVTGKWGKKRHSPTVTSPVPPAEDLPEGTIYLPEIWSDSDVPEADEFLRKYLGELGLLAE